ncbi:MAG TPA: hypothetical protein VH370_02840 [Humisphaera sp.]|nr:hypothetical protein [Humisphaera sp.]
MSRTVVLGGWRAILGGAFASAALLAVGCAQDDGNRSARDTGSAPQSNDGYAASADSAHFTVSRAFPTGNRNNSELLVEEIGPREVRVGTPYTYQVRVTNLTDQKITGIILRQHASDNFAFDEKMREREGRDARIEVGELGPKQSKTVDVTGTASQQGTLDTCLSAQYNPPTLCAQVAIVAPALQAVAEGPSRADVCQELDYRYTVTNTGTGTAHNVVLRMDLPEGLQANGGRGVSLNVGDLGQGQSRTVVARVRADRAGQFRTRAVVASDIGQIQTSEVATAVIAPRLAVTITGPKEQLADQPVTYRIDVKNVGEAAAAHTRLRVGATPGEVEFVNAQGGEGAQLASERQGGGQDLGTIEPGQARTVTINFRTRAGGSNAFDATAQADCAPPVTTSLNTELKTITASALIVTHDPDPVPVGRNVVYHVLVQNKGNETDHDVQVMATLPDGEQFVRGTGKTDVRANGQNLTFGVIPSLEPKQTITWDIEAKAIRAGQVDFKATMTTRSTPNPAVKIEPTKLYGGDTGVQTNTNVAPPVNGQPNQPSNPNRP